MISKPRRVSLQPAKAKTFDNLSKRNEHQHANAVSLVTHGQQLVSTDSQVFAIVVFFGIFFGILGVIGVRRLPDVEWGRVD